MGLNTAIERLKHWLTIPPHPGSAYATAIETLIAAYLAQEQVVNDANATAANAKHQLAKLRKAWDRRMAYEYVIDRGRAGEFAMNSMVHNIPPDEQVAMALAGKQSTSQLIRKLLSSQPQDPPDAP